jgi:hypothetical protein
MSRIHDAESVENLIRLWELCDRLDRRIVMSKAAEQAYQSEAHRHWRIYGHPLEYGCCKGSTAAFLSLDDCLGVTPSSTSMPVVPSPEHRDGKGA